MYPNKNVTSENTELKQAMLKTEHNIYVATSMSSFTLQHFVLLHHRA